MMIQKITIPMDNPLDQGRRIIDQPQRRGITMASKGSKINANEKNSRTSTGVSIHLRTVETPFSSTLSLDDGKDHFAALIETP
jgi:hypothetical protein